jgi:Neuraminidase (sialidase)
VPGRILAALPVALVTVSLAGGASAVTGPEVNVSQRQGPQTNPTVTIDPRDDRIVLAGSNSLLEGAERVYSSTDGGVTWSSTTLTPPVANLRSTCPSDPGVAIDRTGRQYYAFDRSTPCTSDAPSRVYVATRSGPDAAWSKPGLVAPLGTARFDDKPAIVVDASPVSPHLNRVYVVWSHLSRRIAYSILISHSDDHGLTWSRPAKVNHEGDELNYANVATARNGTVYVTWTDMSRYTVQVARSTDGGARFGPEQQVAAFSVVPIPHCGIGIVVPADPRSCIQANPIVSVDTSGGRHSGRVYVSYTGTNFTGDEGASLSTFDSRLRPIAGYPVLGHHRVVTRVPSRTRSDQFWAQSAVDRSDGSVWLCFYDTAGDRTRTRTFFSCAVSGDGGGTWTRPVRVASASSDETLPGARQYGYYQGLAVANGVAHPMWTDTRRLDELQEEIYTARVTRGDLARGG